MRTRATLLAVLLVTAGCLSIVPADAEQAGSPAQQATDAATISVSASGQASAAPDTALVQVAVTASADTADAARQQVADRVDRMRSALRNASVADENVRTTAFRIEVERNPPDFEPEGFRAVHAFEVEVGPDRAGEIIDVAVANGADQVQGVQFTLADETRQALRDQALRQAVERAQADADSIAAAAGVNVTGVQSISTAEPVLVPFETRLGEAGDVAGTTLEPGPVTVTATVTATYRIE